MMVVNTYTESARLVGIELVHRCLSKYGDHILIGDMNTLRYEDYNMKQWADMVTFRSNRHWEPPSGLVTSSQLIIVHFYSLDVCANQMSRTTTK
jgi:hypothetical protein